MRIRHAINIYHYPPLRRLLLRLHLLLHLLLLLLLH